MLARDCLEEFKVECDLRRLSPRTTKSYYNSTPIFLNAHQSQKKRHTDFGSVWRLLSGVPGKKIRILHHSEITVMRLAEPSEW